MAVQFEGFNIPSKTEIEGHSSTYDSTSFKFTLGALVTFYKEG